jgi:protein O-mannosyl-transferase
VSITKLVLAQDDMGQRLNCLSPGDSGSGSAAVNEPSGGSSPLAGQPNQRWTSMMICLLLALAVGMVFGQTVRYGFINYDDDIYVYENPAVTRGLDLDEIARMLTRGNGPDEYYPATGISHLLDWQIYGANAGGHHLTNVLLHAATAILLFLVLRQMTGAMWRSAFVAAVFAIHPLRVESVAWITERKDVLSGLFFMLTLWMWLRYVREQRSMAGGESSRQKSFSIFNPGHWPRDYYLALTFFALGLMSKSTLVMLPFILLLLDYWPLNRLPCSGSPAPSSPVKIWPGLIQEKVPFLVLGCAASIATYLMQKDVVQKAQDATISWRIGNAIMAYADYIAHMIYPAHLALIYSHAAINLLFWRIGFSALFLLLISVGVFIGRRKYPYLLTGWFWYLVMFLPVIDIIQAGDQARADRYTYLPQIGLYILITWLAAELCGSWRRPVLAFAAVIVLVVLSADAYLQTAYWKDSISLWNHTLVYTPESQAAHCNLGIELAARGELDSAVQQFNEALLLKPDDTRSLNNLGTTLSSQEKSDQAIDQFNHVLQLDPDNSVAINNLGVALFAQGKFNDAIQHYKRALQLNPAYANACYNLGNVLASRGSLEDAAQYYEQALQLNPALAEAHCNLGLVRARQGQLDEAVQHYEQALQIKPDYANALDDLGSALSAQGRADEALPYYEQALKLNPGNVEALNNLGVALARKGKLDEAVQHFEQALKFNPNDASTHNNLGIALASQGKLDEAIQHFHQALNLASAQNNTALVQSILTRLQQYESNSSPPPAQ